MRTSHLIGLCILMLSCIQTKDTQSAKELGKVHFRFDKHLPYCGGAKPTQEQLKGSLLPIVNTSFIVKKGSTNHDSIPVFKAFKTDSTGSASIHLPLGNYQILFSEKAKPFEEFMLSKSKESINLKPKGVECFKIWWQSPEAKFEVKDSTRDYRFQLKADCDTGFNPCLVYTGPKRP